MQHPTLLQYKVSKLTSKYPPCLTHLREHTTITHRMNSRKKPVGNAIPGIKPNLCGLVVKNQSNVLNPSLSWLVATFWAKLMRLLNSLIILIYTHHSWQYGPRCDKYPARISVDPQVYGNKYFCPVANRRPIPIRVAW